MFNVVLFVYCFLILNINSQIIPVRFDHAINHLYQYKNFPIKNLMKYVEYNNVITEKLIDYMSITNQTSQCKQDFDNIVQAASFKILWAMKILDSWGKPLPSSILKGNIYWTGDYNECLKPLYLSYNKTFVKQLIDTQYCK